MLIVISSFPHSHVNSHILIPFVFHSVDSNITCTTSPGNTTTIRGQGAVTVILDHMTLSALGFDYDNDPTVSGISPTFSFKA